MFKSNKKRSHLKYIYLKTGIQLLCVSFETENQNFKHKYELKTKNFVLSKSKTVNFHKCTPHLYFFPTYNLCSPSFMSKLIYFSFNYFLLLLILFNFYSYHLQRNLCKCINWTISNLEWRRCLRTLTSENFACCSVKLQL